MEDLSARADHPDKTTVDATLGRRIVAAVNTQESRWFLNGAAAEAQQKFGFRIETPGVKHRLLDAAELQQINPEILITCWSTPHLPDRWIESPACRLRYICHLTGSVRHVVSRRFIERGGKITNWGSIPSGAVAEHALLLALASLRNQPRWRGVFENPAAIATHMEDLRVSTLFGRRVGIHGFGQVAQMLTRLLAPFGVSITSYAPGVPDDILFRAGVRRLATLRELFLSSQVIFECEALTDATRGSVGAAELALLPDDGVLVNIARGGLIQEAALLREAETGRLRIALDVFATEPLPPDSPWLKLPGVVLSPHIAGPTFDQYSACTHTALANIDRYLNHRPLDFVVTPEIYDRST